MEVQPSAIRSIFLPLQHPDRLMTSVTNSTGTVALALKHHV
jgi:hypothetical protein